VEPVQGVVMRIVRTFVTTDIHEPREKPLDDFDPREIRNCITVEREIIPFGEFAYLLVFILPKLPKFLRHVARLTAHNVVIMQKNFPFARAYCDNWKNEVAPDACATEIVSSKHMACWYRSPLDLRNMSPSSCSVIIRPRSHSRNS
jgi:hypothetical protein